MKSSVQQLTVAATPRGANSSVSVEVKELNVIADRGYWRMNWRRLSAEKVATVSMY